MQLSILGRATRLLALAGGLAAVGLGATACSDDNGTAGPGAPRMYNQVQRLGNPLVSEVFVDKREHPHFNTSNPSEDVAQFRDDIARFVTTVAGRDPAYANAVAAALTPDMLVVRTDKVGGGPFGANVGWLTYVLDPANGYGGRKLQGDDVVDKGLAVIFGNALGNNNNVSPGLVTDNVDANDRAHSATFPYVATPN